MRVKDFAPHLSGRMLPGLFSPMPFAKKPRFEGDPWATFPHSPTWFWMHATGCDAGLCRARPIVRQPFPADLDTLFVSLPAASPSQPRPAAMQAVLFPETA
jgi:hypothetical protein